MLGGKDFFSKPSKVLYLTTSWIEAVSSKGSFGVRVSLKGEKPLFLTNSLVKQDDLRSSNLVNVLQEKFLEKGAQTLMSCVSKLPGKTLTHTIQKPQCSRLNFLSAISELENEPEKPSYKTSTMEQL